MGYNTLDALECGIRRRCRIGEHTGGIEDIQALILHRAHIEIVHGHDHEYIQIVLAAKGLLIPGHRILKRVHGVRAFVLIFALDKYLQGDVTTATSGELIFYTNQVTGD